MPRQMALALGLMTPLVLSAMSLPAPDKIPATGGDITIAPVNQASDALSVLKHEDHESHEGSEVRPYP